MSQKCHESVTTQGVARVSRSCRGVSRGVAEASRGCHRDVARTKMSPGMSQDVAGMSQDVAGVTTHRTSAAAPRGTHTLTHTLCVNFDLCVSASRSPGRGESKSHTCWPEYAESRKAHDVDHNQYAQKVESVPQTHGAIGCRGNVVEVSRR